MTIHRSFIALAAAALMPLAGHALTAEEAFRTAPASVLPLIEPGTRLDMLDYFNAGVDRSARNTLYGNSRITAMTPTTISIDVTSASDVDIVLLPYGKSDTAIVVITTVDTPAPDSKVNVYRKDWTPVGPVEPTFDDWLVSRKDRKEVEALLPFMITSCRFSPPTLCFVFENNTEALVGEEVYEPLKPLLRDYIVYGLEPKKHTLTALPRNSANPLNYNQLPK